MNYQSLEKYAGNMYGLSNNGLEYDYEVPDNEVITSPGGTSSTQHHYTKGFYGQGGSSWDIYAGQGQRYIAGNDANMYQQGYSAFDQQGYSMQPPPDPMYSKSYSPHPPRNGNRKGPPGAESFAILDDTDASSSAQTTPVPMYKKSLSFTTSMNPLILLLGCVIFYTAFAFWADAGKDLISKLFHDGKKLDWKIMSLYAIILTSMVMFIALLYNTPIVQIEEL